MTGTIRRGRRSPPRRHRRRRPVPVLVRRRRRARQQPDAGAHRDCDLCIVGGGYTGLWTAIIAKERDPSRDVVLIDAHEIGSAASGRNGGFMESQPDPRRRQRPGALPRRAPAARGARPAEPQRDRGGDQALQHRLRLRAHRASSTSPPRPTRRRYLDELRDDYQQLRSLGQKVEWLDADGDARPGQLADLHRRAVAQGPRRARRPGPAGVGPEGGRRCRSACGSTRTPRRRRSTRTASAC